MRVLDSKDERDREATADARSSSTIYRRNVVTISNALRLLDALGFPM
jgi:hypothetical protein